MFQVVDNEVAINQIAKIKKQLFPNNCLQERYENFITYYLCDGDNFIKRLKNNFKRFSFLEYPSLTFEKPDLKTFRNLKLAYYAMEKGGNMPCILNAANEVAVEAFLQEKIGFLNMSDLIGSCMEKITFVPRPNLEDYVDTNKETRLLAKKLI